MSAIENEAWVEAAARTMCREAGGDPDALNRSGFMMWTYYQEDALAAIRALFPLIIERCADVARCHADEHARSLGAYGAADVDSGRGRQEGHIDAGNAIAQSIIALNHFGDADKMVGALIQKEASDADSK